MKQDYALTDKNAQAAQAKGLVGAAWFRPTVDPAKVRALMVKSDAIALRDTGLWLGAMALCAALAVWFWPSWWSAPFWLIYGTLYGSGADARWHECGHRTAFKTQWMNTVVYHIACFMMMRNPYVWRSSHVRHHTDTVIVGRDPEIVAMRPPDLARVVLNLFGLRDAPIAMARMMSHARGRLTSDEADYVRREDIPKVKRVARLWLLIYAAVIALSVAADTILPLMLVGLPRLYGAWHHVVTGLLQHLGLAENVTDHRLNTRTVMMNPVSRFIYLNMNYHLEHHMFTMVPYYNLPKLHALIRHDLPAADPSIAAAYARLLPVLWRQLRDKDAVIVPDLPKGAAPYGPDAEKLRRHAV